MDGTIILSAVNMVCLVVIIIVIAFLYIEYNRFKRAQDDIVYYLNKANALEPVPAPPTPAPSPTPPPVK
jgi:hypothetical protein